MNAIFRRRSIRKYSDQEIPNSEVEDILRAAMAAPSAGNQQPWHFIVIRNKKMLKEISNINPYANMLEFAPVAVLVCGDTRLEKYEGFWVQDCSAATENMLIELTDRNLGGVWLGFYPVKERVAAVSKLFKLPKEVIPFSVVSMGHPHEHLDPVDRYSEDRIHWENW